MTPSTEEYQLFTRVLRVCAPADFYDCTRTRFGTFWHNSPTYRVITQGGLPMNRVGRIARAIWMPGIHRPIWDANYIACYISPLGGLVIVNCFSEEGISTVGFGGYGKRRNAHIDTNPDRLVAIAYDLINARDAPGPGRQRRKLGISYRQSLNSHLGLIAGPGHFLEMVEEGVGKVTIG